MYIKDANAFVVINITHTIQHENRFTGLAEFALYMKNMSVSYDKFV